MKIKRAIAITIGMILSIGIVVGGFFFFQNASRANDERPGNVTVSEISQNSAKISWTTGVDVSGGVVQYGVSPTALSSFGPSDSPRGKDHSVVLTLLSPETTYYFQITYGENTKFDNEGVPWTFTTKSTQDSSAKGPRPSPIQELEIPATSTNIPPTVPTQQLNCAETNCEAIKAKIGNGCSTQEYIKCIKARQNPSPIN